MCSDGQKGAKASLLPPVPLSISPLARWTNVEQFVTRFLLKESANQIHSLLNSVESAVDAIDEQHCSQSGYPSKVSQQVPDKCYENPVPDYRPNNRVSAAKDAAPRNINTATGVVEVRKETLEAQINRLAELIGRLENKVRTPILLKKSIVIKYKNDTKQKYKCNI
ncbi:unnamed protein product [Oncorhynchus mykiss]|uniref:Uncharacterized protein n=1 Tax=Oncorhynchus mykiss TaxID=8022 RepID=A0A060WU97_ONCMY|nr:unnamed protein product [Oncorhynchus mykiss]